MKIFLKKSTLFNLLIVLLILSSIGLAVKFLLKKEKWVTVELWGTAGEWWWQTEAPPYWIANAIQVGDVEYDASGRKIGEVLEIKKYEDNEKKEFLLKVKLKVDINPKTGSLRYKNNNLEIGNPLIIKPAKKSITGSVVWIEGVEDEREKKDLNITLKLYSAYPWMAEVINVGDKMTDENGEVIAEILNKKVELAEMTVVTDWGEVLARRDPLKRDITLKVRIKVVKAVNQWFFAKTQEVKVANPLRLGMPNYNIDRTVVDNRIISLE